LQAGSEKEQLQTKTESFIKFEKRKVGNSIVAKQLVSEFEFPEHLRSTKNDSEKVREQKKKKVKALKYQHKTQLQEHDAKFKQNEWLSFQKRGSKQSAGHFAFNKTAQSIFKSPDSYTGKVGVVGSGKAMTEYTSVKTLPIKEPDLKRPRIN
jgi:hypothetical protein